LCAAILDRRDTVPTPPFSTAVNKVPVSVNALTPVSEPLYAVT